MQHESIKEIEDEIDAAFFNSPLNNISYSQSLWTILSVVEDIYLNMTHINPLEVDYLHVQTDVLMSALCHPVRAICKNNPNKPAPICHELFDDHYGWAQKWIEDSSVYSNFFSIFSLYWKEKISIRVDGNKLHAENWRTEISHEAYNRLIRKDGDGDEPILNTIKVVEILEGSYRKKGSRFYLNLNPKLAKSLVEIWNEQVYSRYQIPSEWECCHFSFGEFKKVYTSIQAILLGRFVSRSILALQGLPGLGYCDSVWVLGLPELVNMLTRYSGVTHKKVEKIIKYLIFGGMGVRNPDVAIQPIIDLRNGQLALSPFIFMNSNSERNFCVLLNQIPDERMKYASLTQQKERVLKEDLTNEITRLGYRVESGSLGDTDLDLALIDDENKVCLTLELKWFIEPAEIRESIDRSKELEKGVDQARVVSRKFFSRDERLVKDVLKIDESYDFLSVVGSRNWIGGFHVRRESTPIIKVKHLIRELKDKRCLKSIIEWLKSGAYLPVEGTHYEVVDIPLQIGRWQSSWYGIKPLVK
jgi:hypothetical protein